MGDAPLSFSLKTKTLIHTGMVRYYQKSPRFGGWFILRKCASYLGVLLLWIGIAWLFNVSGGWAWAGGAAFVFLFHYFWLRPTYELYGLLDDVKELKDGIPRPEAFFDFIWYTHHFIGRLPARLIFWSYVSQKEKQAFFQQHLKNTIKPVEKGGAPNTPERF